jgi:hypothetical protein
MNSVSERSSAVLRRTCGKSAVAAIGCVLAFSIRTWAQPALVAPFTQITNSPVVAESSMWTIPAWGDYDNDGWPDLFVATYDKQKRNALFHNNRDGTFSKVTTGPLVSELSPVVFGAAWADFDNDGWLDIVMSSNAQGTQAPRLYRNVGGGSFVRMTSADVGSLPDDNCHAFGVSWADYDSDGYLDLYIANGSVDLPSEDFLYHNGGNGRFERVVNAATSSPLATGYGSWADSNNDGRMDLLLTQLYTRNELYRNDGQAQFRDFTDASGLDSADRVSFGAAWGDFDNDGDLDLVIINMGWDGPKVENWFYRNQGNGSFEPITTGPISEDQDHFVSGSWIDYDNDGWLDLFVTTFGSTSAAPGVFNRLYRNLGDGTFARVDAGSLVTLGGRPGSSAAWADYDNDGFLDVCVTYGSLFGAQRNALFRNNTNSNNWIKVRCVGTDSNRSAVGTKVRVKARIGGVDRWQVREIGCNQDWLAFNGLDAAIGLGDATLIDTLRIEWPSGRRQELHNLPVKQTLTLVERTDLSLSVRGSGECELTLYGPRQQHYRMESSTNLATWLPLGSLTVTNANRMASYRHTLANREGSLFFRAVPE